MGTFDFLGKGLKVPFNVRETATTAIGGLEMREGPQKVADGIGIVLGTRLGERPMRPDFGCGIHDLVFEPNSQVTAKRVQSAVKEALDKWEPRIRVDGIEVIPSIVVEPDTKTPELLYVTINFTIKSTNTPGNVVYPFFTGGGGTT